MTYEDMRKQFGMVSSLQELEAIKQNAAKKGDHETLMAAILRSSEIRTAEKDDEIIRAHWQNIFVQEEYWTIVYGKETKLSRTRRKVNSAGEYKTIVDLIESSKASDGFDTLIGLGLPELTVEAIAIRFKERFDERIVKLAEQRLNRKNVDTNKI